MSAINFIRNIIVRLYKGLFYWFFWASFVTMRDEMFCSYTSANKPQSQYAATADSSDPFLESSIINSVYDLPNRLRREMRKRAARACREFASEMTRNLAALRQLMEAAKDLPQRHLVRISLYSG